MNKFSRMCFISLIFSVPYVCCNEPVSDTQQKGAILQRHVHQKAIKKTIDNQSELLESLKRVVSRIQSFVLVSVHRLSYECLFLSPAISRIGDVILILIDICNSKGDLTELNSSIHETEECFYEYSCLETIFEDFCHSGTWYSVPIGFACDVFTKCVDRFKMNLCEILACDRYANSKDLIISKGNLIDWMALNNQRYPLRHSVHEVISILSKMAISISKGDIKLDERIINECLYQIKLIYRTSFDLGTRFKKEAIENYCEQYEKGELKALPIKWMSEKESRENKKTDLQNEIN